MRATKLVFRKSDQHRREAWARRRAALATDKKILGGQCPKALERLFDYSTQLWENRTIETEGLAASAERVVACVQRELLVRDSPLDVKAAFELAYAKAWAIHALVFIGSPKQAKEVELRLTRNAPLAICTGRTWQPQPNRDSAPPFMGSVVTAVVIDGGETHEFRIPAYGCRAIFLDTLQTMRHPWTHWCPDCAPKKSQRPKKVREAHERFIRDWIAARRAASS